MKISVHSRNGKMDKDKLFSLQDVNLTGEDFSGKNLISFTISNSCFNRCRFENMKVDSMCFGAGYDQSTYVECSFDRSDLSGSVLGNARFIRCSFRNVNLYHFLSFKGEFVDCIFSGKIQKTVFYGNLSDDNRKTAKRDFNEFHGNDFSEVDFYDIGFRGGIALTQQKLPENGKYIYVDNAEYLLKHMQQAMINMQDEKLKLEVKIWIMCYKDEILNGQKQLFFRVDEMTNDLSMLIQKIMLIGTSMDNN